MTTTTETIKINLEHGEKKLNLEFQGLRGSTSIARQAIQLFLNEIELEELANEPVIEEEKQEEVKQNITTEDIEEHVKALYGEVDSAIKGDEAKVEDFISTKEEIDYKTEFNNTDLDKFNREYPKIKDAMARNLYQKLVDNMVNQLSYFVTDKGELKLQGRYSCKCGNFKKYWVVYPNGKKTARCTQCSKQNPLVLADSSNFPATDEFGNFYVTSDMLGRKKKEEDGYIKMY